jgi:hypothetical protein
MPAQLIFGQRQARGERSQNREEMMNETYNLTLEHRFDDKPYEITSFAEKHGLNIRTAELLLQANGLSRAKCDAAAMAFLSAVAVYAKRQSAR